MPAKTPLEAFLDRWINASGGELANYGLFVTELCSALELMTLSAQDLRHVGDRDLVSVRTLEQAAG